MGESGRRFLLPMGNINLFDVHQRAVAVGLSTPYGKHKRDGFPHDPGDRSLSTPYGKHKLLGALGDLGAGNTFYSLWET